MQSQQLWTQWIVMLSRGEACNHARNVPSFITLMSLSAICTVKSCKVSSLWREKSVTLELSRRKSMKSRFLANKDSTHHIIWFFPCQDSVCTRRITFWRHAFWCWQPSFSTKYYSGALKSIRRIVCAFVSLIREQSGNHLEPSWGTNPTCMHFGVHTTLTQDTCSANTFSPNIFRKSTCDLLASMRTPWNDSQESTLLSQYWHLCASTGIPMMPTVMQIWRHKRTVSDWISTEDEIAATQA